jgi:hypothetical protein
MRRFQANVVDTANGIELTEPGAPSHILRDLSEYATLASIASSTRAMRETFYWCSNTGIDDTAG